MAPGVVRGKVRRISRTPQKPQIAQVFVMSIMSDDEGRQQAYDIAQPFAI